MNISLKIQMPIIYFSRLTPNGNSIIHTLFSYKMPITYFLYSIISNLLSKKFMNVISIIFIIWKQSTNYLFKSQYKITLITIKNNVQGLFAKSIQLSKIKHCCIEIWIHSKTNLIIANCIVIKKKKSFRNCLFLRDWPVDVDKLCK